MVSLKINFKIKCFYIMIDLKKILTFYQGKLIKVVLEMISKDND